MSLDEPEPVDSVLTFLSGYDTLQYSWVKTTAISMRLRILFVTLQSTTNQPLLLAGPNRTARIGNSKNKEHHGLAQFDRWMLLVIS